LGITFDPNPKAWVDKFPATPGTTPPSSIAAVDKDFKLPQIWRSNLAVDVEMPGKLIFTAEGLFSKDINGIIQHNANQAAPVGTMNAANGADTRPLFGSSNDTRRINSGISDAIILSNTDEGYSYSLTAQLSKEFSKGFAGMVAYTYTDSRDLSGNPGSQASSAWANNLGVRGQND